MDVCIGCQAWRLRSAGRVVDLEFLRGSTRPGGD
jgi:hypothetical protein